MTPLMLQEELVKEIKSLLSGYLYKKPPKQDESEEWEDEEEKEVERVPMNVYSQNLPVNPINDDSDPVPYIIVRLNSGEDKGVRDSNNVVKLVIIIATWDDALDAQGYRDVMNIIQKIYHRFQTNPNLNGVGAYAGEFDWAMQEDNYYPYSFGACSLRFHISAIRREDPFA